MAEPGRCACWSLCVLAEKGSWHGQGSASADVFDDVSLRQAHLVVRDVRVFVTPLKQT